MVQPAASTGRVALQVAHKSDPGLDPDKQINEDSFGYAEVPAGHLLVVCDGMGGHSSGREASQCAIQRIFHEMESHVPAPGPALKRAIEVAGRAVYELGGPAHNRMRPGSTCVSVLVHAGGIEVAHVGDSRGFMIRAGQIYPITRDHSMVQQMIDAGVLTPEQAVGHPDANKITRALGMSPEVEVELRPTPIQLLSGDILLLSSDGLTDLVTPAEIQTAVLQALQVRGLAFACDQLVALANSRGGHDNITVLIGQITATSAEAAARATVPEVVAAAAFPGVSPQGGAAATVPEMPVLGGQQVVPLGSGPSLASAPLGAQPVPLGSGIISPQQPVPVGSGIINPQQPVPVGSGIINPQQPVPVGSGIINPQQPVPVGSGIINPQQVPVGSGIMSPLPSPGVTPQQGSSVAKTQPQAAQGPAPTMIDDPSEGAGGVQGQVGPNWPQPPPAVASRGPGLIVGLVLGAVGFLVLAASLLWAWSKGGQSDAEPDQPTTSASTTTIEPYTDPSGKARPDASSPMSSASGAPTQVPRPARSR